MKKINMKSFSQSHKTFPANVSVYSVKRSKSSRGQENVSLLVRRQKSLTQALCSWWCGSIKGNKGNAGPHHHRINKKALLVFIIVCMSLLIIYANSEQFFRQRIFSMFLSRRDKDPILVDEHASGLINEDKTTKMVEVKTNERLNTPHFLINSTSFIELSSSKVMPSNYNIFVIYTKDNYHLHMKFELFTHSLLKHTNVQLHLHIITDKNSEATVLDIIQKEVQRFRRTLFYTSYDVNACSDRIKDISSTLSTFFSSSPNSYYSDSLFFLSLGLHRIADSNLDRAILLDCDIVFRSDVRLLFDEFERFLPQQLFGLAPELTPVYRHILYRYRVKFPKSNFGSPYYPMLLNKGRAKERQAEQLTHTRIRHGYPGLNSGVVLLFLNRIRISEMYSHKLEPAEVQRLVTKYDFKGHLGDQDLFTLLGYEYPNLIYRLDCVWNRQLCTWWKDHGYSDIFDAYFRCDGNIRMYHGNCNTRIPE